MTQHHIGYAAAALAATLLLPLAVLAQPATWKYEYDAVGNTLRLRGSTVLHDITS